MQDLTIEEKKRLLETMRGAVGIRAGLMTVCNRAGINDVAAAKAWVMLTGKDWYSADIDDEEQIIARLEQDLESAATPARRSPFDTLRSAFAANRWLPSDSNARKEFPVAEGCLHYFPAAFVCIAGLSKAANDKHNPGEPMHHARSKSTDQSDCQLRHAIDAEQPGADRLEELTCKAWRACAELQIYCESLGAPMAPAAKP